jgi:hypothetical protein
MGWTAFVETDLGEIFRVIRPDGSTGGKALLSFLTIVGSGCSKRHLAEEDVIAWINAFNENSEFIFCDVLEKLSNVYFSGYWDYQADEYVFFLHRSPGSEMSEADFKRAVEEVRKMWTGIQELISDTKVLVNEFRKSYLRETDWYVEDDTLGDFEGLLNALILAKERDAKEVRIRIE